jgi:hypothetical protein
MTIAQEKEIDRLEEDNERLERVHSRDKAKIKRLTGQLEIRDSRLGESETEVRKRTREYKTLYKRFEKLGERNKTLEERASDKDEQLERSEKQNAKLRHIVEVCRASSPEPRYDALRQAY